MKKKGNILLILLFVVIALLIKNTKKYVEKIDVCDQKTSASEIKDLGGTAKDLCNNISLKKNEIESEMRGVNILNIATSSLSPSNFRSNGDKNIVGRIIDENLSECDIRKIEEDCRNSSILSATNLIDNFDCKWCRDHALDPSKRCVIKNIKQTNIAKVSQTCSIQSGIESLTKKNTVEAQALAQVLNKYNNKENGIEYKEENCNLINDNMTSNSYLETKSKCANLLTVDQGNSIKWCGNATNIAQENQFTSFQECVIKLHDSKGQDKEREKDKEKDGEIKEDEKKKIETNTTTNKSTYIGLTIIIVFIILLSLTIFLLIE